ncbi:MAG: hypothetical protein JJE51_12690 [Thermoanaerobaculia bacterium]|nr:hypothetical protein [Thermoanaerobaculia bacterium]
MTSPRFLSIVVALSVALSIALYLPTFGSSWIADDIDYINKGAAVLAGEVPLLKALFLPNAEHIVVGFQALFFAYLRLVGIDAFAWRAFVAIIHSLSAIFLAVLARRYSGSARAGFATAVVYLGACGFSSWWIWQPSGAPVPLLMAMLTGSAALLAWRDHLTLRRIVAGALVVAALLTESSFAPMALLPAVVDEYERRREGHRGVGVFSVWTLATIVSVAALVAAICRNSAYSISIDLARGIPRAAFLVLAAPFRFFFPGVPLTAGTDVRVAILGSVLGITVASIVAALLVVLWRRGIPALAALSALSLLGPLGVIALVGIGRASNSYHALYLTERYFFPLLVPAALLAGAVTGSISLQAWSRVSRTLVLASISIAVLGELALHRRAMLGPIPNIVFERHGARFASLARLAALLDRAGPIEIPRQLIWLPDLHNGKLRTSVLTHVLCRQCEGLRLGSGTVDAPTAARLNAVLDSWARSSGEPLPFLRVVKGRLVNTRMQWRVDFSEGDFAHRGVSGFYDWVKPYRWMGRRSEVTIHVGVSDIAVTMAAPISDLRRRFGWESLPVRATLVDVNSGLAFPIGIATIVKDGAQTYSFSTAPLRSTLGTGRAAKLRLECDQTWTAPEPESASDQRPRSVQLFAAGSADDTLP